ncbi:sulfurtransferase [Caldiplasma sukawensis]
MEFSNILIYPEELKNNIDGYFIIDCRYNLMDKEYGKRKFLEGHIPGAVFLDLNEDMAGQVGRVGGRHPIPDLEKFVEKLEKIGLSSGDVVVAYDDNLSGASRLFFLMEMISFKNVRILQGGFNRWLKLSYDIEVGEQKIRKKGKITFKIKRDMEVDHQFILDNRGRITIVDARENERYRGIKEPIDPVPGRIPGSLNIPYKELMSDESSFKPVEELSEIFKKLGDNPVIYCGSGVTACVDYVAMKILGKKPLLYSGSYSDWISRGLSVERDDI